MSKTIVVGVLGALLVGCGGGSSSSDSTGDTDSDSGNGDTSLATLSGRAAIGAPIANAPVDARCADGSGFTDSVTSDSSGRFQGQVGSASLPCALRINGGTVDTTLHSYADAAGNVNITPLTDLILAFATSVSPADWYDQSDRTQRAQGLDAALADFLAALRSQGFSVPGNDFNPFHTPFTIGDAADRLLQNLADAIHAMANVDDYTAFVDLMSSGNLVSIPQAPDPTDTNGGSGNGNGSGGGSGASAAACLGDIFSQEGTVLEQFRGTINPLTGELSETIIDQQEIGGLTSFRGNNARVINRKTVSNSIAPLTLYNRAYMRVDQAASIVHQYGSESLTGQMER